jgi:hypothetical protein
MNRLHYPSAQDFVMAVLFGKKRNCLKSKFKYYSNWRFWTIFMCLQRLFLLKSSSIFALNEFKLACFKNIFLYFCLKFFWNKKYFFNWNTLLLLKIYLYKFPQNHISINSLDQLKLTHDILISNLKSNEATTRGLWLFSLEMQ